MLLAIDDAQWLDLPSARVLEFAIRRLHDVPIGILITARGVEARPAPARSGSSASRTSGSIDCSSVRSRKEATRDLLNAELSTRLPRSVLLQIHGTAAGNPFLALELGRAILRRGIDRDPGSSLPVPSTLVDLVADRLSGLSDPVRQVLLVTAAASQPTASLVAQAIGGTDAERDIEAALDDGVIEASAGRIRPTHPLLATVQYSVSSGHERREVHRRLAAVVIDQEERARHLALSAERPDERVAAELEAASRQASGRGAPDAAAQLADLARELTPADHAEERIHRTIHAGQFAFEAGELGKAAACLEEAVAATSAGPLRAEALLFLARVRYHSHDARSALALAEQALEEVGDDEQLKPHIQLELAAAAEAVGDRARARAHAREAVPLAEAEGDDASLAEALALVGFHDFLAGEPDARSAMSRALELEGAAASIRPLRSPTFRQAMRVDVDGRARYRQIDLRGAGEALPGRRRRGVARGDPVHARRGGVLGRQLVGGRRVRRRELRDHRVDRPPAVPLVGSVREGADRGTPRSSGRLRVRPPRKDWSSHNDRGWCRRVSSTSQPWGSSSCRWTTRRRRTNSCGRSPRACWPRA